MYIAVTMNRILVLVFIFLILAVPQVIFAQSNYQVVTLPENQVVNKDYFAAGRNVSLDGTVNGDAYLAGGDVNVNGVINGDLLIAGGNVTISGLVTGNIRGAGGNIIVNGKVGRNVSLAGGQINLGPNANISGSLTSAGGNLTILGPVGKEANLAGGQINLGNTARIKGDVTYWSRNPANISSEASISGAVTHNIPPQTTRPQAVQVSKTALAGIFTTVKVFSFISALLIGFLILKLIPEYTSFVAEVVRAHWLRSLGIGLLALAVTPLLVILLLVTVIGIPFALLWIVFLGFGLWLSKIFVSVALGSALTKYFKKNWNAYLIYTSGLAIISLIGLIPIVGGIVGFIVALIGLGAIATTKKDYYQTLRQKKLI